MTQEIIDVVNSLQKENLDIREKFIKELRENISLRERLVTQIEHSQILNNTSKKLVEIIFAITQKHREEAKEFKAIGKQLLADNSNELAEAVEQKTKEVIKKMNDKLGTKSTGAKHDN